MKYLLLILLWYIVGIMVLAAVDKDLELLEWIKSCPKEISWGAIPLVFMGWPIVVWLYVKGCKNTKMSKRS